MKCGGIPGILPLLFEMGDNLKNGLLGILAERQGAFISDLRLRPEKKWTALGDMWRMRQKEKYADDFRILCRTRSEAERIKTAVTKWLFERLKLEISPEKTRVVNVKKKYSEFLGFKIKVHRKGEKWTVLSHVCDKALCKQKQSLIEQAKKVVKPPAHSTESYELHLYNAKVIGAQNYYKIATHVNLDFNGLNRAIMTVFINRLRTQKGSRLTRTGRPLTKAEKGLYGNTPMMRYIGLFMQRTLR